MIHAQEPVGWREEHAKQRDQGVRKRTFTVVSDAKVKGKSKGETVVLEMTEAQIDHLISAGFIVEQGFTSPADKVLAPLKEDTEAAHVHYAKAADSAETKDVAGSYPVNKRATSAQTTKKG